MHSFFAQELLSSLIVRQVCDWNIVDRQWSARERTVRVLKHAYDQCLPEVCLFHECILFGAKPVVVFVLGANNELVALLCHAEEHHI